MNVKHFPIYNLRFPRMCATILRSVLLSVLGCLAVLSAGCASPDTPARQFSDILYRYPNAQEPLVIKKLTVSLAAEVAPALQGKTVTIMVHPAYSLFFREERRSKYTEAKYDLLKFQLDSEVRFISEIARSGNPLILVLPGNFLKESIAPLSYTYYLNDAVGTGASVFYLTSESWTNGTLPTESMITLYGFLQKVGAKRMLIGGGYIGRCQREFYNQVSAYLDNVTAYIVPEISSISPDDISDREAAEILASLRRKDYSPVRQFIEDKSHGAAEVLQLPAAPGI